MASLKERLNDNEYKFWIKAGLCLNQTKEGIGKFTDDRSKRTHAFVKKSVERHAIVKNPDGDIKAMGGICNNAKVVKRGDRWSLGCCNDCEIYVNEIAQLSQPPFRIELSNWRNSEVQLWPSESWEIAKVYMNKGQRPFAFQKNSQETDLSGLLNFIDHCRVPWVDIQNKDNITKVRDARNATMHSAFMKMSNADFLVHTDAMIALLQDPLLIDKIEEAQNAVKEIQKIIQIDFVISSTDELRVVTDKTSSLQEQNDRLQEEVSALRIKHTELENSSALRDENTRSLVQTETGQREAAINTLKAEINEKEKQLKELSTEFILVKKLVSQDRDLYRKMDIRVRNVETCWGKTASELTEIKQNHQILAEQVQRIQQEMPIGQFSNLNSKNRAQFDGHVLKCEDEVKLLNEKLTKTEQALEECQCRNKVLVHMLSIASGQNIKVQDKTNLLATEKANKELVAVNEKLTEEIRQLQNELRNTKEPDNGMECTKTTCKSRIEALEYKTEFLESENKSLSSKYDLMKLYAFEKRCSILEAQLAEKEKNETFIEELKHDFLMERTINTQYENQIQGFRADINRITAEKEVQQDKRKKAEAKLKTQIGIFHQEKANQDIELENRNKQIETLVSENDKIYKELQNNSKTFFEFRLQTESNIKSLNERIQNLILENGNLNKELQRNMRKSDEQRLQAQARLASLNINNAKMESDLRRKVDECQRLMQENTDLKTTREDLSRKLATSQEYVAELERSLSTTNIVLKNFEQTSNESAQEIDKMKYNLYKLNNSHEEVKQHFSEAQEKITSKTSECNRLEHTVEDLQRRLETTEQQLSSQNEKSKQSLEVVTQLKQERDELACQVKQISSLTDEREQMVNRQHELESTIKELQRKIEVVDKSRSAVADTAQQKNEELHKTQATYEESPTRYSTHTSSAEERTTRNIGRSISQLSANKSWSIHIKVKDDNGYCDIRGMAVTNNGTILLADENNDNIKSVSPYNKVVSVLSLPESPNAITVLDTTTAVAKANNEKLYIINITDNTTLSLRSESHLDYKIYAMVAYNGNLAVTCGTMPATTKLITIDDRVLWSVCRDTSKQDLFDCPWGITITSITDTTAAVVVSDQLNNTLTLLEAQTGTFIRSVYVGEGKRPWGITTDSGGNVYVCYCGNNEIGVWSADFQDSKILLSGGDQLGERPRCIVYNAVNDRLYDSHLPMSRSCNTVDIFRLV